MGFGSSVWEREGSFERNELSQRQYIAIVSLATFIGLFIAGGIACLTMTWHPGIGMFILFGLVMPIVGIVIALRSDSWEISAIGYLMVCVGLGAIIGPSVALFKTDIVVEAMVATAGVTLIMSIMGIVWPRSLEHWGGWLFAGLCALLLVRLAQLVLISTNTAPTLWYIPLIEYGAALLFSLYIMYDWNRAIRLPYTLNNAIDCALAIFLDIINLFLTLLRIFGGNGSKD